MAEMFFTLLGEYKMHWRPWALTLNLVLFDQLRTFAHKWQWGVRLWHKPYDYIPDGMQRLHDVAPFVPTPPPVPPVPITNTPS